MIEIEPEAGLQRYPLSVLIIVLNLTEVEYNNSQCNYSIIYPPKQKKNTILIVKAPRLRIRNRNRSPFNGLYSTYQVAYASEQKAPQPDTVVPLRVPVIPKP